jgi:hypothetical protein
MTLSKQLVAFHGDPAIKAKYLARVIAHQKADHLIRGTGWKDSKGCAVGCTLEAYDHSRYPIELGIPEWLAQVEDRLFEGMSEEKSRTWPEEFLRACPVGSDLEKIKPEFLIMILESTLTTFNHVAYPELKKVVDGSIALWNRDDISSPAWIEAVWVARAAAEAAWAAAGAAAAEVARAAWVARAAAGAAAWVAAAAARAAAGAREERYDYFAEELLKMLKGCK